MILKSWASILLFFYFTLCITQSAQSQLPGGNGKMGAGRPPAIGKIFGRVLDATDKKPLEYATVTIMPSKKDSIIGGAIVKTNGEFYIDKLPLMELRIRISYIGFQTWTQTIFLSPKASDLDLGNIKMFGDSTILDEIVIEAEKSNFTMGIDRRVFNVDKDLSAKGGTAVDVMKNIPGVSVDGEGNVEVRNQSPTVFVDGRPTSMTLEQIPADQIEKIEIITNPSVKFEAAAKGGIINVVMKKNLKPGYNGTITAGSGTNDRYNGSVALNLREGKWNFGTSYNYNQGFNPGKGYTDRINYLNGKIINGFTQQTQQNFGRVFQFGRINADYQINNRSILTLAANLNKGYFRHLETQSFTLYDSTLQNASTGDRYNKVNTGFDNATLQALYRYTFPGSKQEITSDFNYNPGENTNESLFQTYNFPETGINPERQWNVGGGISNQITWQTDFIAQLKDSAKIEAGIRTNIKSNTTGQDVLFYNSGLGYYEKSMLISANYDIKDQVHAAYFNYLGKIKGWAYAIGLRYEQTVFEAEMKERNLKFSYLYPDGTKNLQKALFPAIYLSKPLKKNSEFQLNFSRKIRRPDYRQAMPFIMFADRQSYSIGNPALAPEFVNLGEANFNKPLKKGNFFLSLYGRYNEDIITAFAYLDPADSSVLVNSFINGRNSKSIGTESSIKYTILKPLDFTLSGNINYLDISAQQATQNIQNSGFNWNAKAMITYRIRKDLVLQLNGDYEAPKIVPQGKTIEVYAVDASINKDFGKKFSINASVNDVFNTRRFGGIYETEVFRQEFSRRRQTRFFRINLTWKFGEADYSLFKRRGGNQRREPGQGGNDLEL
jgi:hypothetical protein